MKKILFLVISFISLLSCNSDYVPKQRGYYKIDFPQHQYRLFDQPGYPYKFEYPVYGEVVQDSTFLENRTENLF